MFTVANAVAVAIMQVGMIIAGVLASGFWYKMATSQGFVIPFWIALVYTIGAAALAVPLVWLSGVLFLRTRQGVPDIIKSLAFWFGVLILIGFAMFVIYATVVPWFWGSLGGGNGEA